MYIFNHIFKFMTMALAMLVALPSMGQVPAPPQKGPVALTDGTVVTVSGETIEQGTVVFDQGKIVAVGRNVTIPEGAEVIDVSGQYVYPAMIHARSTLGLTEVGRVSETVDLNEFGDINPNVRIQVAYHAGSEHISLVRTHGIAVTVATPSGGLISGLSAAMLTDGWTWEDMTLQAPVAMIVNWPNMQNARQREEGLKQLQEAFDSARRYYQAKKAAGQRGIPHHNTDVRWEAMIPVLEGQVPVHIFANEITQIQAAINWAERENLEMVLVGARDAHYVLPQLKAKDIPVIITPVIGSPSRQWEAYDLSYRLPALLHEAGIRFCIAGEASAANVIRLPNHAASAVAFGLPQDEALKSLTLYPAQILGLDDRMGSIEVGKDASIVIADGNLLELSTQVSLVFIQGRMIQMMDKHRRLYELYDQKYRQLGD
jgi:imidazolonepropionase-like amidohydrolase